jgi:tetratricopeptide (TPR) repeat protein
MAEAGRMVAVHEKYKDKGLVLLGVSLDQDRNALLNVVKEKNFSWPQQFDGQGWNNKFAKAWGVNGIPRTFLLDTAGKVVWAGHPARMDQPIEEAFGKTPPVLVDPAVARAAATVLDGVEEAIATGDNAAAIRQFAALPAEARKDGSVEARARSAEEKLAAAAQAMLAEVEPLVEQKQYVAATTKLRELSAVLAKTDAATRARQRLGEINAMPEAQAQLVAAQKESKAAEDLAVAERLAADGSHEQAYVRFRELVKRFPATPAATTAAEAVKKYEQDPSFAQRANEVAAAGKAKGVLSLAQNYRTAGRREQARAKYQEVIDQFPGTSYAQTAAKELAALGR